MTAAVNTTAERLPITAKLIVEAYWKTGLIPERRVFLKMDGNEYSHPGPCGCAVGVLVVLALGLDETLRQHERRIRMRQLLSETYSVSPEFADGLSCGFNYEDKDNQLPDIPEFLVGWRIGRDAHELMFGGNHREANRQPIVSRDDWPLSKGIHHAKSHPCARDRRSPGRNVSGRRRSIVFPRPNKLLADRPRWDVSHLH